MLGWVYGTQHSYKNLGVEEEMDSQLWGKIASFLEQSDSGPKAKAEKPEVGGKREDKVLVVCFSKDRAFQLGQLLRSIFLAAQEVGIQPT